MSGAITPQQTDFLRLLSTTGFITNKHLEQVNFGTPKNSKHYLTKRLLDAGYIGRVMIASPYGIGRKVMYFLAKKGAEFIATTDNIPLEEIAFTRVKGGIHTAKDGGEVSLIRADFPHKEAYISAFLSFLNYLKRTDYTLTDYKHYYQLTGDKNTALPLKNRNFRPDGIWFCEGIYPSDVKFTYVVEIHRHSERKHIIRQLRQQVEAIKEESLKKRFGIDYPHFVLSIFTDENLSAMQGIIKELQEMPEWEYMESFFIFARLEDLKVDFYNGLGYFGDVKKPVPKDLTK